MLKLIALIIHAASVTVRAEACSISVNSLFMKNVMATAAANEYGIALDKVTSISFSNYSKLGIGVGRNLCPTKIKTKVAVAIAYKSASNEACELSVGVTRVAKIGPSAGGETYEFALPASSCEST